MIDLFRLEVILKHQLNFSNFENPILVQIHPYVHQTYFPTNAQFQILAHSDPLAQYYLDWSHFSKTGNEEVEELLNSFWRKVFTPQNETDIQQWLNIMELNSPIPTPQLKVQYRRLAQSHHPDKGGDSEHFKKICQAFHQLKQYNLLSN